MARLFGRSQRQTGRLLLALGLVSVLGSGVAGAKPPAASDDDAAGAESFTVRGPSFEKSLKPVRSTPAEKLGIDFALVPEVRLQAMDTAALLREDAKAEREGFTKVLRFGVGRDLQVAARDGFWYDLPDGKRLWAGEVVSTDALGIRLHFKDVRLPAGAELAVYAPSQSDLAHGVVKSGSPLFDPDRYVEFYEAANSFVKRGDFWTGTLSGERTRIEYLAPAGLASDELPFTVDRLQHIYLDPVDKLAKETANKAAGPCHNDVACFPEWDGIARAVSGIGFVGDNSLFCTGQLLNVSAKTPDFTPYWLTANHCLSSQFEADFAEFFWLYQKATCGGAVPSIANSPRSRGATLVSTNTQSDYTLLLVEGALTVADQLSWAGWTSKEPANGAGAVGIHHPSGDHKRISFAVKEVVNECFQFPGFAGRKLVRATWTTNAVTERGSSGSGIFREDTGQLFGQLLGGPSFCGIQPDGLFDCYGSFATTFTKVKNFLKGGSDDKSDQNDSCAKARVVKGGTLGGRVVKVLDEDWYKVQVKGGQTVNIDLSFFNGNGDIDLQSFGACNGGIAAESLGTTDGEGVSLFNPGSKPAFAYFRVFLANDTRNSYDLSITFE
jgi:hypothetical protein